MTAATRQNTPRTTRLVRFLPILGWLPRYDRSWLAGDVIAGLSVWALMVPQSLGLASVSGVPVQYGLYAAAIGLIVYAIFGSSRHVVTGPSSTIAAVTGAAVLSVAELGSSEAVALVAAITMLAGVLYLALSVLKMGWISNFLAESVLVAFIFGIGIEVTLGQLKYLTGTTASGEQALQKLASWLGSLSDTSAPTLLVGLAALTILFALKIFVPKLPGALVVLVLGIGVSAMLDLSALGVAVVGSVPRGLPGPALPDFGLIQRNLGLIGSAAIGVLLIGFAESLATARQYASKFHYDIDVDQEMLAQGMANVASGAFQGLNVAGSLTKTSVSVAAGGRSQVASLAQGALVVLTLLLLAPLFADLPQAVLAAIVIEAVIFGLMDVKAMRRVYRLNRTEFWVGIAALLGVLLLGTLDGALIGIVLSVMVMVARSSRPRIPVLGRAPGTKTFHRLDENPESVTYRGLVVLRLDGPLFFATAGRLRDRVREVVRDAEEPVKALLIDLEGVDYIDLEGSDALAELGEDLGVAGVEVHLARIKHDVLRMLERDGVDNIIGREHFHPKVIDGVESIHRSGVLPDG